MPTCWPTCHKTVAATLRHNNAPVECAVLLQNKRLLGHLSFLFWITLALCGIHILTKTLLPLNEFKTEVLAGFVEADFVFVPIDGLIHLKNVVQNYSGHHSPLDESTCP